MSHNVLVTISDRHRAARVLGSVYGAPKSSIDGVCEAIRMAKRLHREGTCAVESISEASRWHGVRRDDVVGAILRMRGADEPVEVV